MAVPALRSLQRRLPWIALACVFSLAAPVSAQLTIVTLDDLSFGAIIAGASGAVEVSPQGTRSASGGALLGPSTAVSAARFRVEGDPDAAFSIVVPSSTLLSNGSETMTVDTFLTSPVGSGVLGSTGLAQVDLGATLRIGASQPSGSYHGTFDLTVAYP